MDRSTRDLPSRVPCAPSDRSQYDSRVSISLPIRRERGIRNPLLASSSAGVPLLGSRRTGLYRTWIRALLRKISVLQKATVRSSLHPSLACRSTRSRSARIHEYGRWNSWEWSRFEMPSLPVRLRMGSSCASSGQYSESSRISLVRSQDADI